MASSARFGVVLLPESLAGFGALCRAAEEHGFDLLGVADSQSVFREMYVALRDHQLRAGSERVHAPMDA